MKSPEAPKEKTLVDNAVLLEIAGIRDSLKIVLEFWYESAFLEYPKAAAMIHPTVDRLDGIIKGNNFPE